MSSKAEQGLKLLDPYATYELPKPKSREEELHHQLWKLACLWEKTMEVTHVEQFHRAYLELLSLGWTENFDLDEVIMYERMRRAYPEMFTDTPSLEAAYNAWIEFERKSEEIRGRE